MIITIDGPSGTGKTTIAKRVAKRLGIPYFDTGAMYRSLAYLILKNKIEWESSKQLQDFLEKFSFSIKVEGEERRYLANNEDVTFFIRTPEISMFASQISTLAKVRKALVEKQRDFAKEGSAVFEGRDMGTVVFPYAEKKFFLTAECEERAKRRFSELKEKGMAVDFDAILQDVQERDKLDTTREISPLRSAEDAVVIDTTHFTIEEVENQILEIIRGQ